MPCGKDAMIVNEKPFNQKRIAKFSKFQVPDEFYDKFSEMTPLT